MGRVVDSRGGHPICEHIMSTRSFEIFGAAFGLASRHRGTAKAPEALRRRGLLQRLKQLELDLGITVTDMGDLREPEEPMPITDPKIKYVEEVLNFSNEFMTRLGESYRRGATPLVLGGDHSISISSLSAASMHLKEKHGESAKLGVLWVDAHPDINTPETSFSGNIHGMTIAHLLGHGNEAICTLGGFAPKISPDCIVYIGLRDVDGPERQVIKDLKIPAFSMKEIDLYGIGEVCRRAFSLLEERATKFVVSFDLDVCDPMVAPGVGTPVRGGLSFRESHLIMELAAQSEQCLSIELVEYNPDIDPQDTTGEMAIGLLESALGKSIL